MQKTSTSRERNRMLLLPPCPPDRLPQARLSRFIADTVEQPDPSAIYNSNGGDGWDPPLYDPEMMAFLPFPAYCTGVVRSRKLEKQAHEDIAFRMIAAKRHPDHDSICELRKRHLQALAAFSIRISRLCPETALVRLGHVAPVGTKIKANADRYQRGCSRKSRTCAGGARPDFSVERGLIMPFDLLNG